MSPTYVLGGGKVTAATMQLYQAYAAASCLVFDTVLMYATEYSVHRKGGWSGRGWSFRRDVFYVGACEKPMDYLYIDWESPYSSLVPVQLLRLRDKLREL